MIWLLTLYITASWWCWWFGGAFGHRNFVEYYNMILAIPFAWLFQQVFDSSSRGLKVFMVVLWMALLYYSYMLAVYYHGAHYNWESWKLVAEYMLRFKFWGAFHQ